MSRPTSAPTAWRGTERLGDAAGPPGTGPARWRTPAATARKVLVALLVALVAAVGVWTTWRVFVGTAHGQQVDQAALEGAHIGRTRLWEFAEPVLDVVGVGFIAAALVTCAVIAFVRRRWGLALVAAGVVAGANVTTQGLKHWVLDRPGFGFGPEFNTLPSGHTTAAASVAAAVLLVVPPRARPWAAVLGGAYAGATGVSTLIGQWHRPSDVVAALLVVLLWGALACAVLAVGVDTTEDRRPPTAALRLPGDRGDGRGARGDRRSTAVAAWLLAVATALAGGAAVVALQRTWESADPEGTRAALLTSYGGGALGIVAVAAAASGALLVLRRSATSGSDGTGPRS